jgi:hypothetical protein
MAFALSLSRVGTEVPVSPNFSGGEMKRPTFFAEDETFIRTLLSYAYQRPDISEDELFSNRSLTKNHIDHSLIEVLRDLSDFDLFWKHGSDTLPIEKLSNRTLLIDVHTMPVLKELVAYRVGAKDSRLQQQDGQGAADGNRPAGTLAGCKPKQRQD